MSSQEDGANHLKPANQLKPTRRGDVHRGSNWPGSAGSRGYAAPGGEGLVGLRGLPVQVAHNRAAARLEHTETNHKHKGSYRGLTQRARPSGRPRVRWEKVKDHL